MLLGHTSTEYPAYSTIMYANLIAIINRLGEFGIFVREGEEDLYDDDMMSTLGSST